MNPPQQRPQPSPTDVDNDPKNYASTLRGGLQRKKQRVSPFDRLGAKIERAPQGKPPNGYTD